MSEDPTRSVLLKWLKDHEHWQTSSEDKKRFKWQNKYSEYMKQVRIKNTSEKVEI